MLKEKAIEVVMRSHVRKLRLWAFKVCVRISFGMSLFFKMLSIAGLGKNEQGMAVLKNHPTTGQLPTYSLVKGPGTSS